MVSKVLIALLMVCADGKFSKLVVPEVPKLAEDLLDDPFDPTRAPGKSLPFLSLLCRQLRRFLAHRICCNSICLTGN